MTKTDFAELKEKLCNPQDDTIKYDYNYILLQQDMPKAHGRQFVVVEKYDELKSKSSAIISELIEIIKIQSEALESALIICDMVKFGAPASRKQFLATIDQTTTRLQKLRDGK